MHDDHLGSAHLISDRGGPVEARVLYGPWGAARDGNDWKRPVSEADLDELRWVLGHRPELDAGLINMRGPKSYPRWALHQRGPSDRDALEVGTWTGRVGAEPSRLWWSHGEAGVSRDADRH